MPITTPPQQFGVSFQGIPFLCDVAKVVRLAPTPSDTPASEVPAERKHQPEIDLIDEVNRLIHLGYIEDFGLPPNFPGRNLGALAFHSQTGPKPNPHCKVNDFYYSNSATRWGVFTGLATTTQVKAMLQTVQGVGQSQVNPYAPAPATPGLFVMQTAPLVPPQGAQPVGYRVATQMYLLPPRPLAEHGGQFDGLYLVRLVDDRYWWQFLPGFLLGLGDYKWDDLINELIIQMGISLTFAPTPQIYGTPEYDSQLWANAENAAVLLDAVAYNTGRVVVRNYDGTYQLMTYGDGVTQAFNNRNAVGQLIRTAGGGLFDIRGIALGAGGPQPSVPLAANLVAPIGVNVTFPKYVIGDDPVPHFLNARYANPRQSCWYEESYGDVATVNVPITSGGIYASGLGGTGAFTHTIHDTAKALYNTEKDAAGNPLQTTQNLSGLIGLSVQLAVDYYTAQVGFALDEVYPGTINLYPESIHDIVWTYSARTRFATTRVVKTHWNQLIREMQHGTPPFDPGVGLTGVSGSQSQLISGGSTTFPRGVGGPSVPQTWQDRYGVSGTVKGWTNTNLGPHPSGNIASYLAQSLPFGQTVAFFNNVDNFPTQNRWRGRIENETLLFEAVSGVFLGNSYAVNIVYRAIDGTAQAIVHPAGIPVYQQLPDATYGANAVVFGRNQLVYPHEWQSGGVQTAFVVPQTQSVQVLSNSGVFVNNTLCYSGAVNSYDPTQTTKSGGPPYLGINNFAYSPSSGNPASGWPGSGQTIGTSPQSGFVQTDLIWVTERNNYPLSSGKIYDGQIVGYSIKQSGPQTGVTAPIYQVNWDPPEVQNLRITSGLALQQSGIVKVPSTPPSPYMYAFVRKWDTINKKWLDTELVLYLSGQNN